MPQPESVNRNYRFELARKLIHLSSVIIAIIYCTITKELALVLLVPLFFGFLVVDLMKNFIPPLSRWYHDTFDPMLRKHELEKEPLQFNGATYISFSALLLVLIFPKIIAITCFSLVAVSDTMAALAGKKFGHHRIGEKSLEGSLAFLVSALLIVAIVPRLDLTAGIITAITATAVEAFTLRINRYKIDDNLTIPLVSAFICYLYYILVIPHELPLLEACP
ncbi:MAG: SEC59/DGK1/VTE5 family protein [Chlorobiales bacterium]|nr:SEC59/DGK1/VTE5 family protein [Chlorobiales bacterium]